MLGLDLEEKVWEGQKEHFKIQKDLFAGANDFLDKKSLDVRQRDVDL